MSNCSTTSTTRTALKPAERTWKAVQGDLYGGPGVLRLADDAHVDVDVLRCPQDFAEPLQELTCLERCACHFAPRKIRFDVAGVFSRRRRIIPPAAFHHLRPRADRPHTPRALAPADPPGLRAPRLS